MRKRFTSLVLAFLGVAGLAIISSQSALAQAEPRFYNPRVRCHDAPHVAASNGEFLGRISVLPRGSCLVRQGTRRGEAIQLVDVRVLQEPANGRLTRGGRGSYTYRAGPGADSDDFIVRLIYEGPDGRIFGPVIRYEVRVAR